MFLAATDMCSLCNGTIYPDDEVVASGLDNYHYDCHVESDLPDPADEE